MRLPVWMAGGALAILVVTVALAQTSVRQLTARQRIVLLRNGQTLEGNVTRTGDYYLVTRGTTSEVRLPATAVERVCDDLEALYQYKVAAIAVADRAGHLELARWCLRHDLKARAADQALMAFALDPHGDGLEIVERQLLASQLASEDPVGEDAPGEDASDEEDGQAQRIPTSHEIEEAIATLPSGAVQQFATSVQPLLMNRCATSGCHGYTSEAEFQLLRPGPRQAIPQRITQRNLFSVLDYVDRSNPDQSRLLTILSEPHGGREAVFSEAESHQMQLLAEWVTGLASEPVASLPTTIDQPPAFLLQTRPEAVTAAPTELPEVRPPPAGPRPNESEASDYTPRDPFDPEIFNRRFHRDAPPSE